MLFDRIAGTVALLGQHVQQAQAQVRTLGLLEHGFAQNTGGLAEAAVGDIDAHALKGIRDFVALASSGRQRFDHRLDPPGGGSGGHRRGGGHDPADHRRILDHWRDRHGLARHFGQLPPPPHDQRRGQQQGQQDQRGQEQQVESAGLFGHHRSWHHRRGHRHGSNDGGGNGLGLEFRQLGLQVAQLLLVAGDMLILGLQSSLQFIGVFLQLLVFQGRRGQLFGILRRFRHRRRRGLGSSRRRSTRHHRHIRQQQALAHCQPLAAGIERADALGQLIDTGLAAGVAQALGNDPGTVALDHRITLALGCRRWRDTHRRRLRLQRGTAGRQVIGAGSAARWIEQDRVFAQQTAIGPVDLHQEIQERLADRLVRLHLDHTAVAPQDRREAQVVEEEHPLDTGAAELFGCRQADRQLAFGQVTRIDQGDFRIERLIERRMQGDVAQPHGRGQCRMQQ